MSEKYLIWSNEHRAWWRPDSKGYTVNMGGAGRYSRQEALRICALGRDGWGARTGPSEIPVAEADANECVNAFNAAMTAIS